MISIHQTYCSSNYSNRKTGTEPRFIILHFTEIPFEESLKILTDPSSKPVSSHYLLNDEGKIFQLVPEEKSAWHAGVSSWGEYHNLNNWSIGIEIVHLGYHRHTYNENNPTHITDWSFRAYPTLQINNLILLCKELMQRWSIQPTHVLGHSEIAPERKVDPGHFFPWPALAAKGVAIWPRPALPPSSS